MTRFVLVDDSPAIGELLSKAFESVGFKGTFEHVMDPLKAIEGLIGNPPNLILLDLKMPKLSGWQVLTQIRERGCEVPIVILTTSDMLDDKARAEVPGVLGFCTKPLSMGAMRMSAQQILHLYNTYSPPKRSG